METTTQDRTQRFIEHRPNLPTATEWRSVAGYDGDYEVSSDGRVRSNKRKPRIMRTYNHEGYLRVGLHKHGVSKHVLVHRLVALAFLGHPPTPEHQVNHKDGDKGNAAARNLEWVTRSENHLHSYRELGRICSEHVKRSASKGETHAKAVLSERDVIEIRRRRAAGEAGLAISKDFQVHPATVSRIARRLSRKYCGLAGKP